MISDKRESDVEVFLSTNNLNPSNKRRRQLLEMDEKSFLSYQISIEISASCRDIDLLKAYNAYKKAVDSGISKLLPGNSYTSLLCLLAGLGEPGCGSNQIRLGKPMGDYDKALEVYYHMLEHGIGMNEACYSALIRCCCAQNSSQDYSQGLKQSLELYSAMKKKTMTPRLRTLSSLLAALSRDGTLEQCYELFQDINNLHNTQPAERDFCSVLLACTKARDMQGFCKLEELSTLSIECEAKSGKIFNTVLDQMMEDLLVLSRQDTLDAIKAWYQGVVGSVISVVSIKESGQVIEANGTASPDLLQSIDLSESTRQGLLDQLETFVMQNDKVSSNSGGQAMDSLPETASPRKKFKPNNKLKSIHALDFDTSLAVDSAISAKDAQKNNSSNASSLENPPRERGKSREEQWSSFKDWLVSHGDMFDVIVDGANVGYFKQNFPGAPGHVDYSQIDTMVHCLQRDHGLRPLLILHSRHLSPPLLVDGSQAAAIVAGWQRNENMLFYPTPKAFNDDWFWMYAAVSLRKKIVTNDDMRDHHFQLLSPRYFLRWRERNRITFDMPYSVSAQAANANGCKRNAVVHFPSKYSCRMQVISRADSSKTLYFPPLSQAEESFKEGDEEAEAVSALSFVGANNTEKWLAVYCPNSVRP